MPRVCVSYVRMACALPRLRRFSKITQDPGQSCSCWVVLEAPLATTHSMEKMVPNTSEHLASCPEVVLSCRASVALRVSQTFGMHDAHGR